MNDPFRNPAPLVQRVYAYAAYRLGDGADAEDVTGETFERALRYRDSYDARKGSPAAWLIGIAQRCIADAQRGRADVVTTYDDTLLDQVAAEHGESTALRLDLAAAVATLGRRDRELIALRYGADLKAKDIAVLLEEKTNTVEVALHRALDRLRGVLDGPGPPSGAEAAVTDPPPRAARDTTSG
ncbi:MAG: sigma-70 family RNA polymerase sigma factor [Actinobacteria bacterium]|nr:sigma-70 family RNA polymerase sigma factor [Actinomycetota bacterium]